MSGRLGLFQAYGVELEYMIVDATTFDVRPICDELMKAASGSYESEVERGAISWSNELALHVVELKTNGPADSLDGLAATFQDHVRQVNALLQPMGARLLPTAMHPWMNPHSEMRLWPHEYNEIYESYNRIFDCRGHGWANLQSAHINLPFNGDEEFARLHAAIRLVLPILPALAASSPAYDDKLTGTLDNRLVVYRGNQARIPQVAGRVIPEPVFTEQDYDAQVFQPAFRAIAPHDPGGVLQQEFLNSRGAIARFSRGSIEIRVIDVQECPAADLAIVALVVATLKSLVAETWTPLGDQKRWEIDPLLAIFESCVATAEQTTIADKRYLESLGSNASRATACEVWAGLAERLLPSDSEHWPALRVILGEGTLATRMVKALPKTPSRTNLKSLYCKLSNCLAEGELFRG